MQRTKYYVLAGYFSKEREKNVRKTLCGKFTDMGLLLDTIKMSSNKFVHYLNSDELSY